MDAHYYQRWQELAQEAWGEAPSVRFALDEAWEALEVYANEGGIGWDAVDALEAAEEFLRGASVEMDR